MIAVRKAAVAGRFYPAEPHELRTLIRGYLQAAVVQGAAPKAIIAPHAGYVYSGPVAASAYARLKAVHDRLKRVVLLGPAHWVQLRGLAACSATAFATPFGAVPVEQEAIAPLMTLPQVCMSDEAHTAEHSLEVQLPFLQEVLDQFTLIPLVVGEAAPSEVGEVLEALWGGAETLIVVSSDLSHYHDYDTAQRLDGATARAIETLRPHDIRPEQACGWYAIQGLLQVAHTRGLHAKAIDVRNSGDTAGSYARVVGYGAFVFTEEARGSSGEE